MSIGGFKFAKVTVTSTTSYSTVFDWCLAVHKARCEAFLRATEREVAHWIPLESELSGETTVSINYDNSNTVPVYYAQIASYDSHPAMISFFRDTDSEAEYAILTGDGFRWGSGSSTCCYINPLRLNQMCNVTNLYYLSPSFMHSMAMHGFGDCDVSSGVVENGEIPFTPQYGIGGIFQSNQDSSSSSMIGRYSQSDYVNKNYSFGYAVKGTVIESFYQCDSGFPFWSLIGEIFTEDCIGGNPYGVICCPSAVSGEATTSISNQYWIDSFFTLLCVIDSSGNFYPSKAIHDAVTSYMRARCFPSYNASRPNATIPINVYYGALSCCFDYTYSTTIAGLDSDINLQKGYIHTDILRVVSRRLCADAGSLFQSGNFISMGGGTAGSGNPLGILLGWDPSNDSLL